MPIFTNLDKPANRESVRRLVREEIFEVDLNPDYDREHLRIVEAYCLQYCLENDEMEGDPIAGFEGNKFTVGYVLESGLNFKIGLEVGVALARGDRKAFPSALKKALKQLGDS